ncbi:MAG: hypothetical protein Q9209_004460 [Squamulea sp. 1 TL-2023]
MAQGQIARYLSFRQVKRQASLSHSIKQDADPYEAALRYEMGSGHTFHFVEGIEDLVSPEDRFFAYYVPNSARSFWKAVADLRGYIAAEGPFGGIITFSQSSSLAAAILLEQEYLAANGQTGNLHCAIFISGRLPFIDSGEEMPQLPDRGARIEVPTVHIWGANDNLEPGNAEALSRLCNSMCSYTVIHNGGHEVPGPSDHRALIASTHAIRRALAHTSDVVSSPVSDIAHQKDAEAMD